MRPAARYWLYTTSACLERMGFMRKRREVAVALSGGMEILYGTRLHEPRSVLDLEKTSGKSQKVPRVVVTDGEQPERWKSNMVSCKCRVSGGGADPRGGGSLWEGHHPGNPRAWGGVPSAWVRCRYKGGRRQPQGYCRTGRGRRWCEASAVIPWGGC